MAVPARPRSVGVTAAESGRGVPGITLGRQPAVRRWVLRRSCQSGRGDCPCGRLRPPAERAVRHFAAGTRYLARDHAPDGAARSARP